MSKHTIRHATAWAIHAVLLVAAGSASAANSQTVCSPTVSGYADCSLSLGNVVFNAQGVSSSPNAAVFDGEYGHGSLNLPLADVVQTADGQAITFDPAYYSSTGYSGRTESVYGMHTVSNLTAVAAPGYVLNSVSVRFQGVFTLAGAANVTLSGMGQYPDSRVDTPGDHPFDITFTSSAADLAQGNFPALAWSGLAINGQPLNGDPAVTGLIVMNLDQMTISASVSPVPEGATLALTALGLVGIGLARARHARA
ncbi:hypothetical protein [Aquabacterium sp. CECT 9606]|uniref:hypothetical protein n=1 Tax=Aquabacterium sp. CECT 9606 TaxID=2845822 RepID=UPI001E4B8F12|nr:hypothetical protein [Aquabacterium sp. CECT 9606]CAH0348172.1 hypothetical protein AQB9606_00394 [Aquabacterium sp. CECT 9606]